MTSSNVMASLNSCEWILDGHEDVVSKIVVLSDTEKIATAGADCTVRIFDAPSEDTLRNVHSFNTKSRKRKRMGILNSASGTCLQKGTNHTEWVLDLAVIDEDTIVSVSDDKRAIVWRVSDGAALHIHHLPGLGRSCAALGSGRIAVGVIICGQERTSHDMLELHWDGQMLTALREVVSAHEAEIWNIAVHGQRFITASGDGKAKVWDQATFQCLATLSGHTDVVRCAAFDDIHIVTGSWDGSLRVHEAVSFRHVLSIDAHRDFVRSIQFVDDGRAILSGSKDQTLALHDLHLGSCLWRLNVGIEIYSISAVNNRLVAAAGNKPYDVRLFPRPFINQLAQNGREHGHPSFEVFISHAGPDKYFIAAPLHEELRARRISSFLDQEELKPGDDAVQSMTSAMTTAPILVTITSPEYCIREWTIKELLCFLDRDKMAKLNMRSRGDACNHLPRPGEHGRPIIIPVFYRLTLAQCRYLNLRTDVTDEDEHNMRRYNDMLNRFDPALQRMKKSMRELASWTGIENTMGAMNVENAEMRLRRTELIARIADGVERAVRIVRKR